MTLKAANSFSFPLKCDAILAGHIECASVCVRKNKVPRDVAILKSCCCDNMLFYLLGCEKLRLILQSKLHLLLKFVQIQQKTCVSFSRKPCVPQVVLQLLHNGVRQREARNLFVSYCKNAQSHSRHSCAKTCSTTRPIAQLYKIYRFGAPQISMGRNLIIIISFVKVLTRMNEDDNHGNARLWSKRDRACAN